MKYIKEFKYISDHMKDESEEFVVKSVDYEDFTGEPDDYEGILQINLENGRSLVAEEDSGGEMAVFQIEVLTLKHVKRERSLNPGDVISLIGRSVPLTPYIMYYPEAIKINGEMYKASVGSEGGNPECYLLLL